jgi:hypothetical protein
MRYTFQLVRFGNAMRRSYGEAFAIVLALGWLGTAAPVSAAGFQVLTAGKIARFENRGDPARNGGIVVVGRDRALRTLIDPTCPATSSVEFEAYLTSTFRDAVLAHVDLDCAKWSRAGSGYRYSDPNGTVGSIYYARIGLRIEVGGSGFTPIAGPVGFVQAQLTIADQTLRARFHNFRRNDAQVVWSRRPSTAAALGEAAFWDVLLGDDRSEPHEQKTRQLLERALRYDPGDGRSHFLLAMLHLYRFAQRVERFDQVSAAALDELSAANAAFAHAVPLLWNDAARIGDSRVAGFAAAAKYTQGALQHDDALREQGLADLEHAVEVNSFFNVFDYIPVLQLLPPSDPFFQRAFADFTTYLTDPATLQCVGTQPEICSNAGMAPHNIQGSLTLFGDVYAKGGNLTQATFWYNLAGAVPDTQSWLFKPIIDDRRANAAARVALYADADPSNDPPVIGMGAEACVNCHSR